MVRTRVECITLYSSVCPPSVAAYFLFFQTPGLFAQNFVETLFVLNNYSEHPCYAAAAAGRADAGGGVTMDGIDLGGDSPAQVRR